MSGSESHPSATVPTTSAVPSTAPDAGEEPPIVAAGAVLVASEKIPEGTPECRGFDFDEVAPTAGPEGPSSGASLDALMESFATTGFQATNVGLAIHEINRMIQWRLSEEEIAEDEDEEWKDPDVRAKTKCTIFLGFTSNMISCGVREIMRFLVQHKMVDAIVTTTGGIEEDFMKTFHPHYMGDFGFDGEFLRKRGFNRIGNLIVPNTHYCSFEDWLAPLLHRMHDEQDRDGTVWTPSSMIHRMGLEINHPESVWYWAAKNDIPVFCPSLTDGSVGDMLFFHSYRRAGFTLDIARDIRRINEMALKAKRSGMIILGGGLVKHHICNANLMRNGAEHAVYINTGTGFDGSDSGAHPSEALSWGKIRLGAKPVKIYAEATLVWPLIVSQTFAKHGTRLPAATAELAAFRAAAHDNEAEGEGAAAGGGASADGLDGSGYPLAMSRAERIQLAVRDIKAGRVGGGRKALAGRTLADIEAERSGSSETDH